jgi:drug/metabolite transporter (DMT)-like permease
MTVPPWHLLFPFAAAIVFAGANLALKRALELGAGPVRALALTNLCLAAAFSTLILGSNGMHAADLWKPALGGLAYFIGQWLNVTALRAGDVSLVTPLMGAKVIFVALFSGALALAPTGPQAAAAAGLTAAGVFIMGAGDLHAGPKMARTTALALGSAACFAVCDMTILAWAQAVGKAAFLAVLFATVGAASIGVWSLRERVFPHGEARRRTAHRWLHVSIALTGAQSILISSTIARFGDATRVNVVYSLRAIFGVAIVWFAGTRLGSREGTDAGHRRMAGRLLGAVVIVAAVLLAVSG